MKKVLVINGPNLNMLGTRETQIYGKVSLKNIEDGCVDLAKSLKMKITFFQSNSESEIIEKIQSSYKSFHALIINAGAFTHTSIAIHDSLKLLSFPIIEVHLSNLSVRENFRQKSLITPLSFGSITGFGHIVYKVALYSLKTIWEKYEN